MNNLVPTTPAVGFRSGDWVWDGTNWICDPDCSPSQPCPPFGPPVFSGPAGQPPWYPGANGGVSFGASAPNNPVRGHLWWNGATFFLFDGATWVPFGGAGAGGGAATGTTPPANPFPGQQWFNGSVLFVWDGNAWIPTSTTRSFIQATAPAAPNPGDTWWNGTQMRIWDGSVWQLVGPGATTGPVPTTTRVFSLLAGGTITLATNADWTIVPFTTTPTIDTETGWDPVTKKYQPKRAGNYLFFSTSTDGQTQSSGHAIVKNDSGTWLVDSQVTVTVAVVGAIIGLGVYYQSSGMVFLNGSTDFVRLWGLSSSATFVPLGVMPAMEAWLLP